MVSGLVDLDDRVESAVSTGEYIDGKGLTILMLSDIIAQ
jgi:hypothetical protein